MTNTQLALSAGPTTNTALAWSVLVDPRRAFASLRDEPRFWFALIAGALPFALLFAWYYSRVDMAWLADHILSADPRLKDMSDAERAAATEHLSAGVMMATTLFGVLVGVPLLRVIESLYFFLAGRAMAVPLSFRHWMALSNWSAWPHVLGVVVMAVALLMKGNGQIAPEALNLLSLNELVFRLPPSHPWATFLSTLTLLHPWVWALTVLGVRQWTGRSLAFGIVFGLLPAILLYGGWALFIAFAG